MFAAMSENLDFFKPKISLAIMLAPSTRITEDSIKNIPLLNQTKDITSAIKILKSLGPELFPNP